MLSLLLLLALAEPDPDLPVYEKTLKDAGVSTEPAALLKLFRDRTPSAQDRERLDEAVRRLGSRSFQMRSKAEQDLIKAGRLALPVLRPALANPDIEVRRRAERCISAIESSIDAPLLNSAARLLAVRSAPETVEVLLGYLPTANDEYVIESVHAALAVAGIKDGQPVPPLVAALKDPEASRRIAVAVVVGQTHEKQRRILRPLLADTEPAVRLEAAIALFRIGESEAALTLLRMLSDAPAPLAARAEEVLCQIAGEKAPLITLGGDDKTRRACRDVWEKWWKSNADEIDWKSRSVEQPALGLTLVCEAQLGNGGRVFECGRDGKARWTVRCNNPIDAQMLPGNRVLIADCHGGKVVEMDREGKELWSHTCSQPISVQRLPNGNTFIASHNTIWEVTREGKMIYSFMRNGYVYYARKLKSGMIVVVSSDGVLAEVDTAGQELAKVSLGGMANWAGIEVLPGGRYLVARSGANEVVEVDRAGKVLWQVAVKNPNSAVRLNNGNTLVASHDDKMVYEFSRAGKEVWRRQVEGSPFRARRR